MKVHRLSLVLASLLFLVGVDGALAVTLSPGDILVATGTTSAVVRVNPSTGAQDVVSSGGSFSSLLAGIAIDSSGQIVVVDPDAVGGGGAVIRVNPTTGAQTIVSSGGLFVDPFGIAIAASGDILIADRNAFGGGGGVIRVNPTTGAQTVVSSGGDFVDPTGIAIDGAGQILVADSNSLIGGGDGLGGGAGAIIRVNPATGVQTVVAAGSPFKDPLLLIFDAMAGQILVADQTAFGLPGPGAIFRVDPVTGVRTTVSSGGSFEDPTGIALDAAGQILVTDQNGASPTPGGPGAVFRVDPVTGTQTLVSSAGSLAQPYGIAVVQAASVPGPATLLLVGFGLLGAVATHWLRGRQ